MVFSTAVRLAGNDGQAEDIAQEVFLRAYEHFGDLRTSPTAGGWLKTVATNLALNYLSRYRKRWRMFSELRPAEADAEPAPELGPPQPDTLLADLGAEQRRALIDGALRQLPDHQRVALVLYHFEELS
ncbi:MAG: sigma-70 family RNA polymerase sigma factor, partial [Steroidobacteraceae bacterium]